MTYGPEESVLHNSAPQVVGGSYSDLRRDCAYSIAVSSWFSVTLSLTLCRRTFQVLS